MLANENEDDDWEDPAAAEQSDSEADSEEAEPPSSPEAEEGDDPRVMGVARTLHKNLGHPSRRALVRALRLRGAPKAIISAIKRLKCSICDALKPPRTHRSSALLRARYFLDRVHIDLLQI